AGGPVTMNFASANGSATAGSDYLAVSGSGTIASGQSSMVINVTVNGDTAIEPDETFWLNLSGVTGATVADGQAVGTISNDDFLPTLSIGDVSIAEGNTGSKLATFTVTLNKAAAGPVTYNIATANGTAVAPGDYAATSLANQAISAGQLSKTFTVSI